MMETPDLFLMQTKHLSFYHLRREFSLKWWESSQDSLQGINYFRKSYSMIAQSTNGKGSPLD